MPNITKTETGLLVTCDCGKKIEISKGLRAKAVDLEPEEPNDKKKTKKDDIDEFLDD